MKKLSLTVALLGLSVSGIPLTYADETPNKTRNNSASTLHVNAGSYLASRFAQNNHDWVNANHFVQEIIEEENSDFALMERSMVLSIGANNMDKAIETANIVKEDIPKHILADIILITEAFKNKDYHTVRTLFKNLPDNSTANFVRPFIKGWSEAAKGNINIDDLRGNTAQLYHAILISDYLGDHKKIEKIIDQTLNVEAIQPSELYRIADLYGHIGQTEKAIKVYETLKEKVADDKDIIQKVNELKKGTSSPLFESVSSIEHGMARSFHDIAMLLYTQGNDENSRIFAHLALYLQPELTETTFLVASLNTRHHLYDDAVRYLKKIPPTNGRYADAQHQIADIYDEQGRFDDAIHLLEKLEKKHNNIETTIKIGDLHRTQSNFGLALKHYNRALKALDGKVTDEYWHLHYVRGIAFEQVNNWSKAEKELKAALEFRPNNPYVLNYLGYAWADQGINLQESLAMIQKAVDLKPTDGYITDSLGWVLYRQKNFARAVTILERAVELLPYDPTINDHLGDAYWMVGRRLEARFQWERAKNHSEDTQQVQDINEKLISGPTDS